MRGGVEESRIDPQESCATGSGCLLPDAGTVDLVRSADRLLAAQLYQRGVSLLAIENALTLAAARRLICPEAAAPLGTIRSLAYFLPVIEEVLHLPVHPEHFFYLRQKGQRATQPRQGRQLFTRSDSKQQRHARPRRG